MTSTRSRRRARSRWAGILVLGPCFAGCAAMSKDVDLYYRQMAINYHEATETAKRDEASMKNQLRVLGTTGDQSGYLKAQRKLERLQSWEEKCAKEEKRFEKAAEWMESHFDIKKPKLGNEAGVGGAVPDGGAGTDPKPAGVDSTDSQAARGSTTEELKND